MRTQRFESAHDRQALLFQRGIRGTVVFRQDAGELLQLMDHHIVMLRLSKVLMNGALSVLQHLSRIIDYPEKL